MHPINRNNQSTKTLTNAWNEYHDTKIAYFYNKRHRDKVGRRGWYAVFDDGLYVFVAETYVLAMKAARKEAGIWK